MPLLLVWLNIKGFLLSAYYQVWLSTNNYEKVKSLHNLSGDTKRVEYTEEQLLRIRQISQVINRIQNKAPWKPKCYNLALTARKLLLEQEIICQMKIGFRKRFNQIEGHAWVVCNRTAVSGYVNDLKSYNVLKPIKNQ